MGTSSSLIELIVTDAGGSLAKDVAARPDGRGNRVSRIGGGKSGESREWVISHGVVGGEKSAQCEIAP